MRLRQSRLLVVENARHALALLLLAICGRAGRAVRSAIPAPCIESDANVAADAYVGAHAYIGKARVDRSRERRSVTGAYVGDGVAIGESAWIHRTPA